MPDSAPITPEIMGPDEQLPLTARPAAAALAGGPAPADPGHSRVGQIFHSVLDTLSGGQSEPAMNDKGAIAEQPVTRTGGEWARRLLAGAFTGLASGAAAPVRPGAGALAGLGAGFAGETAQLEKQDVEKRQQLQKNFENEAAQKQAGNEDLLRKAQTAYLTTQNTSLGFQLARSKAEATDKAVESFNAFETAVAASPENKDLGVFPDMAAVVAYHKEHPELTDQIAGHPNAGGQLFASPALVQDEEGNWKYQGVRAAVITQDVKNQTVTQVFGDKPVPGIPYFVPGKMKADGTQEPGTWQTAQPAAGTRYGDYMAALQKGAVDAGRENSALTAAQTAAEKARVGAEGATASAETARAENLRAQTDQLMNGGQDELGRPLPPVPQKERLKRYDTFTKDYVKDKDQLEQSYQQMQQILARATPTKDNPKGQMTGADSVVGLFNAIGISSAPLKGRGFRINSNIIGEHVGARNVFESAAAGLSKLTPNGSGEVVTPKQLQDYTAIISQARHDMYVSMSQEAERQGLPKDFLPRGNGRTLDVPTAKIFLDSYGNDPQVALSAASKFGWAVPQSPSRAQ